MTATAVIDGDNVIITFEFSPLIEAGQNIIDLVSKAHYKDDPLNPWDELTNQEKLDIVEKAIRMHIMNIADRQRVIEARAIASANTPIDL